ncbi:MAG: hypothetical protein SH820_10800 [Xanthomonadales bacterium]|nr:hypothetical protein [Xanthomonadales bacterium]
MQIPTSRFNSRKYSALLHYLATVVGLLASSIFMGLLQAADSTQAEVQRSVHNDVCIILLHGLGRSSMSMKGVQWRLEEAGYPVVNNSYPWLGRSIEEIAPIAINESLSHCTEMGLSKIGFVTHSLGGILLRQYLEENTIAGLGRVVMLAPPNQGSTMADQLVANGMLEPLLPQPAYQLGTDENSVPKRLGTVNFELGVIAGNNTRVLLAPGLDDLANDGTVAVEETRVAGMQDFIVLPVDHSFLMWRSAVLDQIVLFLGQGRFDHSSESSPQQ